jgi:membrane fusion protein, multidrug efflux system
MRTEVTARALLRVATITAASLALMACGRQQAEGGAPGAPAAGGGAPPAMPVGVITAQPGPVTLSSERAGRLEAYRSAQVRARVSGIVQKRHFTEGSLVKAGQVLFTLDSGSWRAAVANAQAAAARSSASVAQAKEQVERNEPLAAARAISQQEWLAVRTALKQAQAESAAAAAGVESARVNLGYATITAPIDGRIGRAQVSEGALVGPADPTPMALIQQTDTLYLNFTQPAAELMRLRRQVAEGRLRRVGEGAVEVKVVMEDGSVYPLPAKLLFADPTVDAATGQTTLRAEVPNPDRVLLPGLFVRVRIDEAVSEKAVLVPQQAVTRDVAGDSVLIVGADNKPQPRSVKIGGARDGQWIVLEGLSSADRVIVDGFQKLRPGALVAPVPWSPTAGNGGKATPGVASPAPGAASSPPSGASSPDAASSPSR